MFNWWLRCDCRGVFRFYISFNLFAINFCWTSVYFLNMCRENEPIKEMLTTAENRNNLATIKAATTKNWHTHGERETERAARERETERDGRRMRRTRSLPVALGQSKTNQVAHSVTITTWHLHKSCFMPPMKWNNNSVRRWTKTELHRAKKWLHFYMSNGL